MSAERFEKYKGTLEFVFRASAPEGTCFYCGRRFSSGQLENELLFVSVKGEGVKGEDGPWVPYRHICAECFFMDDEDDDFIS